MEEKKNHIQYSVFSSQYSVRMYMGRLALMIISPKDGKLFPFFMSTLGIIQPHLKSFSAFI